MTVEDLANILHRLPRGMEIGIKCEGYLIRDLKIDKAFVNGNHLRDESYNPTLSSKQDIRGERYYDTEVITIGDIG